MTIEQVRSGRTLPIFNPINLPTSGLMTQLQPTVFVDRDGVINHNRVDHVLSWKDFQFVDGSLQALALLHEAGYQVVVVTNQAAITRGLISVQELDGIHRRMQDAIEESGGKVKSVLYCRHLPTAGCDCRKPKPGLLFQAARSYKIDLPSSWLIGDHITDIQAGLAAGCKPILVLTGRGQAAYDSWLLNQQQASSRADTIDFAAANLLKIKTNLLEAVDFILTNERSRI
jgi:D-glycero-D-manno-heptose 1,7-bisphosphate phosphatase